MNPDFPQDFPQNIFTFDVEHNHKQICTLSVTRPYKTSCHGAAEIAKYKACDSNQTTVEITESNTNKRPKATTCIFFGVSLALQA